MNAAQILLYALISVGCILGIATAVTAIHWVNARQSSRSRVE
jgi:hypothetical protein